jgi:hypothetical protein
MARGIEKLEACRAEHAHVLLEEDVEVIACRISYTKRKGN